MMLNGHLIKEGETQRRLFMLRSEHLVRDVRAWKSSADLYARSEYRLKPEIEEWMRDNQIPFTWRSGYGLCRIYIDDDQHAMLFKMTWM